MKPIIKPIHSRSAGSTAVLEYLARIYPLTARKAELIHVFIQADTRTTATCTLDKRVTDAINNMRRSQLISQSEGDVWSLIPPAEVLPEVPKAVPQKAPKKQDIPYVGKRATAPRYNLLSSFYKPKAWDVPRSGAQDFKTFPSVGGC